MTTVRHRGKAMSPHFAVFNLHVNNAGEKADAEFIRTFGQKRFDRYIKPHHDKGIMSIFDVPPGTYRLVWVMMVTAIVNAEARRS
jgi:hypothetical protein